MARIVDKTSAEPVLPDSTRIAPETADLFQLALAHSPIVLFSQDSFLRYTWIFNLQPDFDESAYYGKTDFDLLSEQDARELTRLKQTVLDSGVRLHTEIRITYPNRSRAFDVTIEPLRSVTGNVVGIAGAATDITELREIRDAKQRSDILSLLATNASLTEILGALVAGAERRDPEMLCSILLVDKHGERLVHGAAPSLPQFYIDAINGLEIGPSTGSCGAAAFSGQRVVVEDVMNHPNWEPFREVTAKAGLRACWAEPIVSPTGTVIGTFAMYYREPRTPSQIDIDFISESARLAGIAIERKQSIDALKKSEERYRGLFENTLEAILVTDDNASIIDANPAACRMLGYSLNELHRLHLWNLWPFEQKSSNSKTWKAFLSEGAQQGDFQLTCKDSSTVFVEYRAVANFLPGHHLSLLRDVSASKKAEDEMRTHQLQLAHVARISTVGEMASGIAHEIGQPLSAISNYLRGCLNRLQQREVHPDELIDILHRIEQQSQRASDVVRNLREFVSKGELTGTLSDINQLITEAIQLAAHDLGENNVAIETRLDTGLPQIVVDRIQIEQVVLNLIRNSIEAFSTDANTDSTIDISTCLNRQREIEIRVGDNGPGLDHADMSQLFEPFFSTKSSGMGMGLAISRTIIESHGGQLLASPNKERGVTFCITLPLEKK